MEVITKIIDTVILGQADPLPLLNQGVILFIAVIAYIIIGFLTGAIAVPFLLKGDSNAPVFGYERLFGGVFWWFTLPAAIARWAYETIKKFIEWIFNEG